MTAMCTVYQLHSTRDHRPRYVGQTRTSLRTRLMHHIASAHEGRKTRVYRWMREEIAAGFEIRIVAIHENAEWNRTEVQVISQWRAKGADLLNILRGGDDTPQKLVARIMAKKGKGKDKEARREALVKAKAERKEAYRLKRERQEKRREALKLRKEARRNPGKMNQDNRESPPKLHVVPDEDTIRSSVIASMRRAELNRQVLDGALTYRNMTKARANSNGTGPWVLKHPEECIAYAKALLPEI